jgi:dipeptidyl aminopeptidase/acylaminoacyl peptidase
MNKTAIALIGFLPHAVSASLFNWPAHAEGPPRLPASARDPKEVRRATEAFLSEPAIPLNISPDGSRLLMQREDPSGYSLVLIDQKTMRTIATTHTGARPRLTSWSPDGGKIAYATDRGGAEYQLWLWDLETRRVLRPQVPTTHIVTQAKWSSGGRFLTHVVEHKNERVLFRVEAKDGAMPIQVARELTPKASIAWSPDGTAIATVSSAAPFALTIVDPSGRARRIPFEDGAEIRDVAYSPDGRALLVTVRRKVDQHFGLALVELRKGTIQVMPAPPVVGDVVAPVFLPGGKGVIYRVYPGNDKLIFACDRDGSRCRRLGPDTGQVTPWAVSPDGRTLFVGQLQPRAVHQIDIATGEAIPIFEAPPPEGVGKDGGRLNVSSFDGLEIPIHVRLAKPVPGIEPALLVQVLGGIGKESPAPWDGKAQYLYQRGISVLKIYVRGKAGFGRKWQDAPGGGAARVKDVLTVLDYATRVLKISPGRIVLFGHSDGALLAAKAAAADAPIGALVISSMVKDTEPTPPKKNRCVVAFHGSQDRLLPERARSEIESVVGTNATREPCGRFQVLEGEAHELERAESWGEVFAAIVTALKSAGQDVHPYAERRGNVEH